MIISDFTLFEYKCKGKTPMWDNPSVSLWIHIADGKTANQFLSENIDSINSRLEWLEINRPLIENSLIENQLLEATEELILSSKKVGDNVYLLDDGQQVSVPLLRDDLLKSLYVSELEISYDPNDKKPLPVTYFYLHCKPDYLTGYCFLITVTGDNRIIECCILTEDGCLKGLSDD